MSKEKEETVRIPIEATYQLYNGRLTLIDAKYADVSTDAIVFSFTKHPSKLTNFKIYGIIPTYLRDYC